MREVLVFGGTTEGRLLVEWLDARASCRVVACTATDYGAELLPAGERVQVLAGALSDDEKRRLVTEHAPCCIVDATHPYARHISESLRRLAHEGGIDLVRVVREGPEAGPWTSVPDAASAARHLAATRGNILLTTGSKDLATFFRGIADAAARLRVRLLPSAEALAHARSLGIPAAHLIAMQGPFSQAMNEALIREWDIRSLVTKESGQAGGFEEKARAAQACGVALVVIERPREEGGVPLGAAQALLEERYGL